jgi:hypothetical protein
VCYKKQFMFQSYRMAEYYMNERGEATTVSVIVLFCVVRFLSTKNTWLFDARDIMYVRFGMLSFWVCRSEHPEYSEFCKNRGGFSEWVLVDMSAFFICHLGKQNTRSINQIQCSTWIKGQLCGYASWSI